MLAATLDQYSPPSGPFCILGLRYLQKAIADAHSSDPSSPLARLDFKIEFKPFQLDPTLTNDVLDKRKRAEKKFGKQQFERFEAMLKQKTKDVGVDL
jgi:predicted DsbA family dithiol-disulfide isomerase